MKGSNYLSCNICAARFAMYLKQKSKYQMYTNPYYTQKVGLSIYAPFKHTLRSSHSLRYSFLFACSRRSFTLLLSLCLSFTLFVIIYLMLSLFMLPILLFLLSTNLCQHYLSHNMGTYGMK